MKEWKHYRDERLVNLSLAQAILLFHILAPSEVDDVVIGMTS